MEPMAILEGKGSYSTSLSFEERSAFSLSAWSVVPRFRNHANPVKAVSGKCGRCQ